LSHAWKSSGEKRTVSWEHSPQEEIVSYLEDMRDAIRYSLQVAYRDTTREGGRIPSPIQLRREVREWFYSRYDYARHHINSVCRTAVAMLRSYRKNHHGELRIPQVKRLAMRIDGELFRMVDGDGDIRVTLQPNHYAWIPINRANKHYEEYSMGRPSELLVTGTKICLTFVVGKEKKLLGRELIASDLNFSSVDSTRAAFRDGTAELVSVRTESIRRITMVQNDFSRRRRMLQQHVRNLQKRATKIRETRGRQRNRIKDTLHKLSTEIVKANPDASFVFENLKGIRRNGENNTGRRFRTYLNRWPYRMYQSMVEYKSPKRLVYVSPRGTSSECPVCGEELEHPTWAVSRCNKCGVDYDRNRLASLAILCRGLRLCGQPFAVSADASWHQMRNEYLHTPNRPESERAGWTNAASALNGNVVYESTRS
jgi:putative transposase